MATTTVQIRRNGVITLPIELRNRYGLEEGSVLTLVDLGDGAFLFSSHVSHLARLGDQVARLMAEEQVSLDEVLDALDQERERYCTKYLEQAGG